MQGIGVASDHTRPVLSLRMLDQKSLAEIGNRLGIPASLNIGHRVFAAVDPLLQRLGLIPGRRRIPVWELPDGVAALATDAGPVIQNECARAGLRDAYAESRHVTVVS